MKLVNATYLIQKTGFYSSWARHLLSSRLKPVKIENRFRMYKKEEVDELIQEHIESKEPKRDNEWDLHDIKDHFNICYTFAQRMAKCEGFPEPVRRIKGERASNHKRVWLSNAIKRVNPRDYPECWVRNKTKPRKQKTKMTDVEMKFLRGFRL